MVTVKHLTIKRDYKYLWIKHINGVDLSQHCAKCLLGDYDSRISKEKHEYHDLTLPDSKYHYLCGVLNYYNNLHLAFREKDGEVVRYEDANVAIEIANAELLPISAEYIDWKLPKAGLKSYHTCRNWQFANWVKRNEIKEQTGNTR